MEKFFSDMGFLQAYILCKVQVQSHRTLIRDDSFSKMTVLVPNAINQYQSHLLCIPTTKVVGLLEDGIPKASLIHAA